MQRRRKRRTSPDKLRRDSIENQPSTSVMDTNSSAIEIDIKHSRLEGMSNIHVDKNIRFCCGFKLSTLSMVVISILLSTTSCHGRNFVFYSV